MVTFPEIPGFKIEKLLGQGGTGLVYGAVDLQLKRRVAIKTLHLELRHPIIVARFEKEAHIAANLYHTNIISIFDIGLTTNSQDSFSYIVMEFLEESLRDQLAKGMNFQFQPEVALGITVSIMTALSYAHKQNVIHRDIKPHNIMFRRDSTPVLVDFGIARVIDTVTEITKSGAMLGTAAYMSPEQSKAKKDIDGRTDIYSLGVVLFEMLTGRKPYIAENPIRLALMHIEAPIPKLPENLSQYQYLIDCMMAKNKDERIASLDDFERIASDIGDRQNFSRLEPGNDDGEGLENIPAEFSNTFNSINELNSKTQASEDITGTIFKKGHSSAPQPDLIVFNKQETSGGTQKKKGEPVSVKTSGYWYNNFNKKVILFIACIILSVVLFSLIRLSPNRGDEFHTDGKESIEIPTFSTNINNLLLPKVPVVSRQRLDEIFKIINKEKKQQLSMNTAKFKPRRRKQPNQARLEVKIVPIPQHSPRFRSYAKLLTTDELRSFLVKKNIFDKRHNPEGNFVGDMVKIVQKTRGVFKDRATGLMWHDTLSGGKSYKSARMWLKRINKNKYWGHDDWRIPTVEEAATLLKRVKNSNGMHCQLVFHSRIAGFWTCDRFDSQKQWVVLFSGGFIYAPDIRSKNHVFLVRTIKAGEEEIK